MVNNSELVLKEYKNCIKKGIKKTKQPKLADLITSKKFFSKKKQMAQVTIQDSNIAPKLNIKNLIIVLFLI